MLSKVRWCWMNVNEKGCPKDASNGMNFKSVWTDQLECECQTGMRVEKSEKRVRIDSKEQRHQEKRRTVGN